MGCSRKERRCVPCLLVHIGFERSRPVAGADQLEQIAEALRPGQRRCLRRSHKELRVDLFRKLGEYRRHLVEPAGMMGIADKIDRRGLAVRVHVDGGVNLETASACVDAGADVLVAASAIFGADDPAGAARELRRAAGVA